MTNDCSKLRRIFIFSGSQRQLAGGPVANASVGVMKTLCINNQLLQALQARGLGTAFGEGELSLAENSSA